jgi:hypothetical protein
MDWHEGQAVTILDQEGRVRHTGRITWEPRGSVFYVSVDNSYKTIGGFKVKDGSGNASDCRNLRAVPAQLGHVVHPRYVALDVIHDTHWEQLPDSVLEQVAKTVILHHKGRVPTDAQQPSAG